MEINVDTTSATVSLSISGRFTAEQLQNLLEQIANARGQISNDPTDPIGLTVKTFSPAYWYTNLDANNTALFFRVGGFGWQALILEPAGRMKLAWTLLGQQLQSMTAAAEPGATAPITNNDAISGGGGPLH